MAATSGICARVAIALRIGGVEPIDIGQQHQQSASIMEATRAPSRSLSPKRISAVATVSFSLITGTALRSSSVFSVARALR